MSKLFGRLDLQQELIFWTRQAWQWRWVIRLAFVLAFILSFGPCTAIAVVLPSYLAFINAFTWLIAIYTSINLFLIIFCHAWFNIFLRNYFASLHGRWIAVYDHLFARDLVDARTRLKYNPFFHNYTPLTNEAKFMAVIVHQTTEAQWQATPTRQRKAMQGRDKLVLDLIDRQFVICSRTLSWKRFAMWMVPIMIVLIVLVLTFVFMYPSQGDGRFVLIIALPIPLFIGLLVRYGRANIQIRKFQRKLISTAGVSLLHLNFILEEKWGHQFLVKMGLVAQELNAVLQPISRNFRPLIRCWQGVFLPLNELRALAIYFGLPFDSEDALVASRKHQPRFELKF